MVYTVFYKTSSFAGYCFLDKNSINPKRYDVFSFKAFNAILVKIQFCSFIVKTLFDFFSWIQGLILLIISVIISIGNMSIIPVVITYLIFFIESAPGIFYTHKYIFKERNVPERIGMALLSPLRSVVRGLAILSLLKQKLFGWYYDTGRKEGKDKGWKNL